MPSCAARASASRVGIRVENPTTSTPRPCTNLRRLRAWWSFGREGFGTASTALFLFMLGLLDRAGGSPNGAQNSHLRTAAALEPAQRFADLRFIWLTCGGKQVSGVHDPTVL